MTTILAVLVVYLYIGILLVSVVWEPVRSKSEGGFSFYAAAVLLVFLYGIVLTIEFIARVAGRRRRIVPM